MEHDSEGSKYGTYQHHQVTLDFLFEILYGKGYLPVSSSNLAGVPFVKFLAEERFDL